jgi:hypothetical protein
MPDDFYVLKLNDVNRIRRMLAWFEGTPQGAERRDGGTPSISNRRTIELAKADSTIAGTTTVTPGSGTCSIYTFTSTGGTSDTGLNVTAYNLSKDSIASGRWLHLIRHHRSGRWLINYEDCGTTS